MTDMLSVLTRARELVARGWVQNKTATALDGNPVSYHNPGAAKFCATGALWRAIHDTKTIDSLELRNRLYAYLGKYVPWSEHDLIVFNDDEHTTQQDILELLDTAIKDLEEADDDDH